jgi:hypothetical protein
MNQDEVWAACKMTTINGSWYYTPLGSWEATGPIAKLTREQALAVQGACTEEEVEIVPYPVSKTERATLEAIVKEELKAPPKDILPATWTRFLLALFENALTTEEARDEQVFRGSIRFVRESPFLLTMTAPPIF